jgi:hypothetical protein
MVNTGSLVSIQRQVSDNKTTNPSLSQNQMMTKRKEQGTTM